MKKILYILLSIFFLALSVHPLNWAFFIFIAFVPLLLLARESSFLVTLLSGTFAGLAYFGLLFYWIGIYTPPGAALMIGGLAVYFGFYLALTGFFLKRSSDIWFDWIFPGVLWIALKWLVSFWKPGFLALHIADSFGADLRQSIYLVGENGLVLFALLVNGWVFNFVRVKKAGREHMIQLLVLAMILLGMNAFARSRLGEKIPADIPVAIIQPDLTYDTEWRKNHYEEIKTVYADLTRRVMISKPRLIVWPQYAFPEDLRVTPNPASRLAAELKTPILLGTYVKAADGAPLNEALYFDAAGKLAGEYAATFLPPLRFTGQKKGTTLGLIDTAIGRAGILLCFEDTHPDLARELVKRGADYLVVLANDQFFGLSGEPYLHASRDVIRAIETDRFIIRSVPTGPSQIIDPRGRVLMSTDLFKQAVLTSQIARREGAGPFARTGDLIPYLALMALVVLFARRRRFLLQ
ncbi:MAG: hypothetical protein HZC17_07325 [Candidatus Omnitrophica bacterium]|nr:hypothetical protein [Candidatus Omnitrophota bacterium]